MQVSTFKNAYSPAEPVHTSVGSILKRFQQEDKNGIGSLRDKTEEEYNRAKAALPIVTFGGTFTYRSNSNLIKASGLMTLDFDKVNLIEIEERLKADKYIYTFFLSPSGKGYKALVKIPVVKNDTQYKEYYYSFMKRYPELDTSGKDISRACFFSFDPGLNINEQAETWTEKHKEDGPVFRKNIFTDYSIINKVLNIIRYAIEGERNNKIVRASKLMGGYISGGKVEYDEGLRLLLNEAESVNPGDRSNRKAIETAIQYGLSQPITEKETIEIEAEETERRLGKIYHTAWDLSSEIENLYQNGQTRGYDTGLESFDKIYSIKPGTTSYIYGAPYDGKTQFWFDILIRLSERHGLKHAIFSPRPRLIPDRT